LPIRIINIFTPKNKCYFVDAVIGGEKISRGVQSDPSCLWNWIAICAATDRRESNRLDVILDRKLQGIPITIRQHLRLTVFTPSPNRANRVNDKPRAKMISASHFRFAGSTTAENPAFGEQLGPGGAMNCTVDSSATKERRFRSVYDRVYIKFRDIALDYLDSAITIVHCYGASRSITQVPSDWRV